MKILAVLLIAATLLVGVGCAKQDWIDRTLVTVDVTGAWSGTLMTAGSGGSGGARDVVFELEQQGSTVKGSMRVTPRGMAPSNVEGTVTVSGDEMEGPVTTGAERGRLTLRRVDPSSPPASPPR